MEGLEAVELNSNEIFNSDNFGRIDSEYYQKNFLNKERKLKTFDFKRIAEIASVTDGEHGSPDLDDQSGIIYLSGNNIKENVIDFENVRYCSLKLHQKNLRSALTEGSVLMSIVGTVGKASIVHKKILANTDRNVATIKNISNQINPYWLSVFLNSKFGTFQTQRFSTGNVQPLLNLLQVKSIVIPIFSELFQKKIESLIKNTHADLDQSKLYFSSAETLLLETLGLSNFEPSAEPVNVKGFKESFLSTGRLDAEYYQKKFDELDVIIKATNNWNTLENILTYNSRGKQPNYVENGYPVINSKHVRANKIIVDDLRQATKEDNTVLIVKGDVLINGTGVGTIGRAATYLHDEPAIPDNHVTILRTNKISPLYLSVFLNSLAGQYQVEKYFKGSSGQIELYPDDINKFLIWVAPYDIQAKIEQTISEAFVLEKQSERLLETAKRAVEIAIEQDEEAAIDYIQNTNL